MTANPMMVQAILSIAQAQIVDTLQGPLGVGCYTGLNDTS
jgi:hypothetical protein